MDTLDSLNGLRLAAIRSKGYTAAQIAELTEIVQSLFTDANTSIEDLETNAIRGVKKNGAVIAPESNVVDIDVPTKTSELTNNSGFATTTEVTEAIETAGHLKATVVEELPATSDADVNTLYLMAKAGRDTGNQYEMYKLVNGLFECVGGAEADLSAYATTESVAKAGTALITSIFNTQESSSEKYVGTGNLATFWALVKPLIGNNSANISDLTSRVELLELICSGDVSGNPFTVTFASLDGITVTGVWNTSDAQIEY